MRWSYEIRMKLGGKRDNKWVELGVGPRDVSNEYGNSTMDGLAVRLA